MYEHVKYISHMGNDAGVANDARISFDALADMFTEEQNESLIKFLARGVRTSEWNSLIGQLSKGVGSEAEGLLLQIRRMADHWTPFAHTAIKLRMNAPVPIRTQCFKHKSGLVENEESRRYIKSEPEVYIPEYFRSSAKDTKQGSGGKHPESDFWKEEYENTVNQCVETYLQMVENGVCSEQARFILPQGCIVNWVWTGNLYSFANFYNKRTDPHAQKEIRDVAYEVGDVIAPLFPISWEALVGPEKITN